MPSYMPIRKNIHVNQLLHDSIMFEAFKHEGDTGWRYPLRISCHTAHKAALDGYLRQRHCTWGKALAYGIPGSPIEHVILGQLTRLDTASHSFDMRTSVGVVDCCSKSFRPTQGSMQGNTRRHQVTEC